MTELEAHLHKLEEDHRNKQLALALDTRLVRLVIMYQLSSEFFSNKQMHGHKEETGLSR